MAIGSVNGTSHGNPQGILPKKYIWQQTPTVVQNYLDITTYDPTDTTSTNITSYAPTTENLNNPDTKPVGVNVTTDAGTLEQGGYKKTVSAGTNTLYNAVPNRETAYSLINGETKQTGVLAPTGALRWINSATHNMRDLGGWNCDGGTVKYGKLFRGADTVASDKDMVINQLHITKELDLMGSDSTDTESLWGIEYVRFDDCEYYSITKRDLWQKIFRTVFDSINYSENLYFHCSAGKDRTGTLAVLLEGLLGVSRSDIDKDFELSAFCWGTQDTGEPDKPLRTQQFYQNLMNSINAVALPANVSSTFRNHIIYFLASLGFTAEDINAFRAAMIDGVPEQISLVLNSYSVTKTVPPEISFDNAADTISEYQPYIANITAPDNAAFNITITMGGADAKQYFTGQVHCPGNTTHNVTANLTGCTRNNLASTVIDNESYACEIAADVGYFLEDANITITMGGADAKQYFILHN